MKFLHNSFRGSDETWNDPICKDNWMRHKAGHLGLRGLVRLGEKMQTLYSTNACHHTMGPKSPSRREYHYRYNMYEKPREWTPFDGEMFLKVS